MRVAQETRDYLTNDAERLEVDVGGAPFYSEREILHMIDVKRLMARTFDAGWAALGFIIAFVAVTAWRSRGRVLPALARSTLSACGVVALLVVVLGVIGLTGFDSAFRNFHLLFFTNDLWQLSSRDGLIQLFPQRFFFDTTLLIGGDADLRRLCGGAVGDLSVVPATRRLADAGSGFGLFVGDRFVPTGREQQTIVPHDPGVLLFVLAGVGIDKT